VDDGREMQKLQITMAVLAISKRADSAAALLSQSDMRNNALHGISNSAGIR